MRLSPLLNTRNDNAVMDINMTTFAAVTMNEKIINKKIKELLGVYNDVDNGRGGHDNGRGGYDGITDIVDLAMVRAGFMRQQDPLLANSF